jgi:uncharacterized membrane protein YfcA
MALTRLFGGWIAVVAWLLLWELVGSRFGAVRGQRKIGPLPAHLGEALLLTLLGGLWFGSLGAGGWWLVFGLVGALREWPASKPIGLSLLRVLRTVVAGGLLAWRLAPA